MSARVGFIGLGIMGSRMAARLRGTGHELVVWNRTADRARRWAEQHGALAVSTPAEVAAAAEAIVLGERSGIDRESTGTRCSPCWPRDRARRRCSS